MKTIVTLTPLAVEADSRTFKQAASMARFGYKSIVIEGKPSAVNRSDLPFILYSLRSRKNGQPPLPTAAARMKPASGTLTTLKQRFQNNPLLKPVWELSAYLFYSLYWWGLRTYLAAPKADVYYLHAFLQFPAVYLLCRRHRARYIYDAHDFYSCIEENWEVSGLRKYVFRPFERWLETCCIQQAAALVTVSPGVARLHQEHFGKTALVVRNCPDRRLARSPAYTLRQMLGLPPDAFLIVVIGNEKKGAASRDLMAALHRLPEEVHIAFVGSGYEPHRAYIVQAGLTRRVHLVPPVQPTEVEGFIRDAEVSAIIYYPRSVNYLHALPNKFFHAIAAGLPLLYSELPEIKQIAEQYNLGLPINPQDPESVRTAVMELFQNPEKLAQFRHNALQAREDLCWEKEDLLLQQLLREID